MSTIQNEFEKFPKLADYIQEYASFGHFSHWSGFLEELNKTLTQRDLEGSPSAGVFRNDNPKKDGEYFCYIRHRFAGDEEPNEMDSVEFRKGKWDMAEGWRVVKYLDESPSIPKESEKDKRITELEKQVADFKKDIQRRKKSDELNMTDSDYDY